MFNKKTSLFLISYQSQNIGICGVEEYTDCLKFKNVFILPRFRRMGFYEEVFTKRFEMAKNKKKRRIKATCTPMSLRFWLKKGAEIKKRYKNKCVDVEMYIGE